MSPSVRLLKDRVVVEVTPLESSGGVLLPQTENTPAVGIVKEVASNITDLSVGDKVVFPKYVGEKNPYFGENSLIFSAYQIIAVLSKK